LYSTICPVCGNKLILVDRKGYKRIRIMRCDNCGFKEDRIETISHFIGL